jgi:hypothetical protein
MIAKCLGISRRSGRMGIASRSKTGIVAARCRKAFTAFNRSCLSLADPWYGPCGSAEGVETTSI